MGNPTTDIAVVGGGAAGFFAAIAARRANAAARVTLFERAAKVLAKVEVTGGGRCNLTNSFAGITDLSQAYPRGHKLMKRLFKTFDHEDTCRWFEENGVPLVTQPDECGFPRAQDAHAVMDCLMRQAARLGVTVCCHSCLIDMQSMPDGRLELFFQNGTRRVFHRVIVTTGGSPQARGLYYLKCMGHRVESPVPSLFTFNICDRSFRDLMGTVVDPVEVSIPGTKLRARGALLVTHWGASGPAILKLSSYAARWLAEHDYRAPLAVCWTARLARQEVEETLAGIVAANPRKQLGSLRPFGLPSRLWLYLIGKMGLEPTKPWGETGRKTLNRMLETLVNDQYTIAGKGSYRDEFVTCGGVSLKSIDPNTLQSRVCPGLYFAGEVLDIDAITGGFNLQAAWTTGYVAGQMAAGIKP